MKRSALSLTQSQRELWITSSVQLFLEKYGKSEEAIILTQVIAHALSGTDEKNGCIRLLNSSFLLYITDAAVVDGSERVVVWHGPLDGGIFFKDTILEKIFPYGFSLM